MANSTLMQSRAIRQRGNDEWALCALAYLSSRAAKRRFNSPCTASE
jgi:hypothetical protein